MTDFGSLRVPALRSGVWAEGDAPAAAAATSSAAAALLLVRVIESTVVAFTPVQRTDRRFRRGGELDRRAL
ncbi:MAG: hypothetical protein WC580_00530 [Agrococcus sp.]